MRAHFVERHRRQLQSRKKICAQSLKMMAHETAHFAGRFFRAEGDLDVMKSETPIFSKNEPGAEAQRVSKCKCSPQWQKTNQGKTCAVNKINEILEHRSRPARQFLRAGAPVGGNSRQDQALATAMVSRADVRQQRQRISYPSAEHSGGYDGGKMVATSVCRSTAKLFVATVRPRAMGHHVFSTGPRGSFPA